MLTGLDELLLLVARTLSSLLRLVSCMRFASTLQRSAFVSFNSSMGAAIETTIAAALWRCTRAMPDYRLVLERADGNEPEIVPHYDSVVAFGPGMVLPQREGEIWLVDRTNASGLTLYCKLVVSP